MSTYENEGLALRIVGLIESEMPQIDLDVWVDPFEIAQLGLDDCVQHSSDRFAAVWTAERVRGFLFDGTQGSLLAYFESLRTCETLTNEPRCYTRVDAEHPIYVYFRDYLMLQIILGNQIEDSFRGTVAHETGLPNTSLSSEKRSSNAAAEAGGTLDMLRRVTPLKKSHLISLGYQEAQQADPVIVDTMLGRIKIGSAEPLG